jgi:hypothetical protein
MVSVVQSNDFKVLIGNFVDIAVLRKLCPSHMFFKVVIGNFSSVSKFARSINITIYILFQRSRGFMLKTSSS